MNYREDFLKRRTAQADATAAPEGAPEKKREMSVKGLRQVFGQSIIGAAKMTRLEESWAAFPFAAAAYIYQHWQTLVSRSRIGCEDYDHLRRFISLIKDNVPGPNGFRLTSAPLEPDGTVDRVAARAIMKAFKEWSRPDNCDFEGRMSRAEMERLATATAAKDGEAIALIHTGPDAGPWGFSVELKDAMLLNPRQYEKLPNGNYVRHALEFPEGGGRVQAFHFMEQDEQQMGYFVSYRGTKRIPAENVVHWFVPEIVGQKRGLPWTRTALWRLRMLSGGEDAALTNFRISASQMGFFTDTGNDDVPDEDLPMDIDPGTFTNIGQRDFKTFNPQFPDAAIDPFIRTMLRSIATGLLTSYHSLSGDLTSVSFSSIRQGTLDDRQSFLAIQGSQEDQWCLPIFDRWLKYSLLAGKIKLPNGRPLPFEKYQKYTTAAFTGRRWPWIDPSSEANAAQIMIAQRLRTRSEIIRDIGDRDPEEVWEEMEAENKQMSERGIVPLIPAGSAPQLAPGESATVPNDPPEEPTAETTPPAAPKKPQ